MRLVVDAHKCSGHGGWYSVVPDLPEADDEGFVTARGSALDHPPTSMLLTAAS
jgi:ferredoxin